jgi:hypothetical protein
MAQSLNITVSSSHPSWKIQILRSQSEC